MQPAGDVAPMDLSRWARHRQGRQRRQECKGKGRGKGKDKEGECNKDEKDKDKDKKCKGNGKAKATEYFAGYWLLCMAWGHMKKDCWWNESAQSGKDTASLETPITPVANTTTEPPITGLLIQSDEGGAVLADPTQWLYSATKRVSSHIDFEIDSGAATSVCQECLADSLGGKPRGPGVELRSVTGHQFTTTGNTTICLRTRDGINVAGDFQIAPKNTGLQRSIMSVGQMCDSGNIITFRSMERYSTSSLATESSLNVLVVCIGVGKHKV